ncbi:serine/threonine protein kinase [Stanieria sp. NIES-3757]|nr:serine/threonine protein kinase [Stanieria sp. NIES-3757]
MSYCLNPSCPKPINHPKAKICRACGSKLLLRDRYHLVKGLGKGGFGATFLAADISLPSNPLCVIKQLRPNTDNPSFLSMARQLFEREAKTLGRIGSHPQIPRLLDYFEDRKQFYLVQEFVKGNNLQQEIKKHGLLNEEKVRQVLKEILVILKDIHNQKVIHRDIKPANIIRREIDDKLVLIDFGVVKNQVNTVASNNNNTALTAFAVGTPGFAPPEQLAMRPVYASDIYALGVTCVYLLTGKAPKNMECDPLTGEINWDKYLNVSESFSQILHTMLEVSVKNRYKTADEALQALDIENHLDSLSESMFSYPSGNVDPFSNSSSGRGNRSRMADNLRSRHTSINPAAKRTIASQDYKKTQIQGNRNSFSRGTSIGRNSSELKKSTSFGTSAYDSNRPVKLEAQALLDSYSTGRRDFNLKDFSQQNLEKANISGAHFHESKFIKTNLQGANLTGVDLSSADIRQALLRNANLCRAYLYSANLEGADLRGADLSFTQFSGAKLKGANLCGANLSNANITEEQLKEAKTNWMTVLPNGRRGLW